MRHATPRRAIVSGHRSFVVRRSSFVIRHQSILVVLYVHFLFFLAAPTPILALVLAACPNQRGTVNGVDVDSILPDIGGPDLADMATALYSGSRDFMVKWRSAA